MINLEPHAHRGRHVRRRPAGWIAPRTRGAPLRDRLNQGRRARAAIALAFAVTAALLPPAHAATSYSMQVDARGLTNTSFLLLRTTPDPHSFGILDGTVVQTLDLTPGIYRFQPGSGLVMSCVLRVTDGGAWDYDTSCDGFLGGRGSSSLRVEGYPLNLDARPLSNTGVLLGHLFDGRILDADTVQPLQLVPAWGYTAQVGSGQLCDCFWTVALDGTVQYPTEFDSFMAGRGTDTVVLNGHDVFVDARALSTREFVLTGTFGLARPHLDATTVQRLTLLPIGYGYLFQYLSIANFTWNVDRAGGISYPSTSDAYLAGRGTDTLRIIGYPVEVDATALGAGTFHVLNVAHDTLDRSTIQSLVLVPAGFEFFTRDFRFGWSLQEDGTVDFDPAFEPCVSGRGTRRLTVRCDPTARVVEVDVKPGSERNPINLTGERIPVAVLTTDAFDAGTLDPASVCFGDAERPAERDCTEAHGRGHREDVDGDGDVDLVLHYETAETGIDATDTSACLHGETLAGEPVRGCDAIDASLP